MATLAAPARQPGGVGQRGPRGPRRRSPWFHVAMIPFTLLYISPLVFVVTVAFRSFDDIVTRGLGALPASFTFDGFTTAFGAGTRNALLNSAIVTVTTVLLTLLLASMAAYALSRFAIPYRRTILLVMLAGNLLPPQILLIPVSKISEALGIYDTLTALIVVQLGFGLGFYTFVLHGFMRGIPREVFEAAIVDGAGAGRTYLRIVLPLCRPALAALGALATTWVFNDLIWAMTVLRTETKFPITAALLNLQGSFVSEWNVVAAGAIIAAVPPAIVFFLFQKHFVSGLLVGANK
ncbi:binding-protein-dependent transport systems inner membrane component [Beutenbergia cavernae DSM 12333]|uniref:Binding-protein-dependent transport systems inner membrane component n=1 Tax=Beutenbergia cavernae (strain ATCC BAA-8 / DSM 12333 / CCUG 43141 / JCM 11478 / NBRC 16432 / NCIMB 13614 / HKI 0122) TaxID=471853 RepID=C5BZN1_BEUC1|nr:carbohydrate ABC transporter permease [Beutenbergia cavernae]ACQ79203.1 binding-protein-dependent transport systems inner membrane component [Beutenbergia cavernae DSM 12333]